MADGAAQNASDLVYMVGFQHRRAVELGNRETDLELRKRYSWFVRLLNSAQQALEPNYSPLSVDEPVLVDEPCPLCKQNRKVVKYIKEVTKNGS